MLVESFIGSSYTAQSGLADCEKTSNFILERMPPTARGAKSQMVMYARPGAQEWADVAIAGVFRATFSERGRAFGIIGTKFYEFNEHGGETPRGDVAVDGNPATICSNGDAGGQLFITSGGNGYCYDLATDVLTQIANLNGKATMGAMLDGYFFALDASTSSLYLSDLEDGLTWDPTQVAQRSLAGDPWRAIVVSLAQRKLILLGETTGEIWANAGTFPFPFEPWSTSLLPYGIAAAFSVRDVGGLTLWVAQNADGNGQVVMTSGLEPRVISTPALQLAFDAYSTIDDFIATTFEYLGHTFYLMTSQQANATWVYDLTVPGEWVEWSSWVGGAETAWRPLYHMFAFGKHLMGDRTSSKIWEISQSFASDVDGEPIRCVRRAPLPWANNKRVFVSRLELLHEPGLGVASGQGADPKVSLRLSFNAGKTSGAERLRRLGRQGEYDRQAVWSRCGSGLKPVVEIVVTDPAPLRIVGLDAEMSVGI